MAWIGGLLVISIAVAGAIIAFALPIIGSPGRGQLFVRFCIIAGIAAVGSTLMYAIYETTATVLALAVGDTFMVLGPGGILLALRALSGRLRSATIVVSCAVLAVAATTALIGLPVSALVKVSALLLLCVLTARETRVAPIVGEAGALTLLLVNAGYAAFSFGRIAVALTLGMDSPLYRAAFSIYPTTAVGIVAVAGTGVAVVRMAVARGVGGRMSPDGPESAYSVDGWSVGLPAVDDLRAAFGSSTVSRLRADLREACEVIGADGAPEATVLARRRSHQVFSQALSAELESRGWSESEIAMVVIVPDERTDG
ncbi:hypothetical protein [Microbacterium schleiferi]|uniref:Uncharacterized protein n=1 Tax=Microbacterium schleiferi TaxID=69362 RepID=A0ABU7V5B2_9MICO